MRAVLCLLALAASTDALDPPTAGDQTQAPEERTNTIEWTQESSPSIKGYLIRAEETSGVSNTLIVQEAVGADVRSYTFALSPGESSKATVRSCADADCSGVTSSGTMKATAVMPASAPDQVGNGVWTSGETWETADEPASACPSTHPYAYNAYSTTGSYCCATADGNGAGQAGMNAHPDRQSRSNTCNGNQWEKCENPPCADYGDGSEFGRYITLKWTVPPNNGDELINHLVARDDGLAGAVDYLVCCPNAKQGGSQGCIGDDCCVDSVGVKSVDVVSGAGVCEEDALIRVVIGCTSKESQDAPAIRQGQACPAAEWLEPQTEYKLSLIHI